MRHIRGAAGKPYEHDVLLNCGVPPAIAKCCRAGLRTGLCSPLVAVVPDHSHHCLPPSCPLHLRCLLLTANAGWRYDLTDEEAIDLGQRAIYHATHRDAMSGGINNLYIVKPDGWRKVWSGDVNVLHERYKADGTSAAMEPPESMKRAEAAAAADRAAALAAGVGAGAGAAAGGAGAGSA